MTNVGHEQQDLEDDSAILDDFDALPLKRFLAADKRPTVVLHRSHDGAKIVFENTTFRRLCDGSLESDLRHWVSTCFGGACSRTEAQHRWRHWSAVSLGDRWCVVCSDSENLGGQQKTLGTNATDGSLAQLLAAKDNTLASAMATLGWGQFEAAPSAHERWVLEYPWHTTPLGSIGSWPVSLRLAVTTTLKDPDPAILMWGPEIVFLYNEACTTWLAEKHPHALGTSANEVFGELWHLVKPDVDAALFSGVASKQQRAPLFMDRRGFSEEVFFDYKLIPIADGDQRVGIFDQLTECTDKVMHERKQTIVDAVDLALEAALTVPQLWPAFTAALSSFENDFPFVLVYSASIDVEPTSPDCPKEADGWLSPASFTCAASFGIAPDALQLPDPVLPLSRRGTGHHTLLAAVERALASHNIVTMVVEDGSLPPELAITVVGRGFGDRIRSLYVLPIYLGSDANSIGFVIVSLNPRRPHDEQQQLLARSLRDRLHSAATMLGFPEKVKRQRETFAEREVSLNQKLRATTRESRRLEERFTKMAQSSPVGMYILDVDLQLEFVNNAWLSLNGAEREVLLSSVKAKGSSWFYDYVVDEDVPSVAEAITRMLANHSATSVEYRVKKPGPKHADQRTGDEMLEPTYVLANFTPEVAEDGAVRAVYGWLADLSHERAAQRLLSQRLMAAQDAKRQSENFIDMTCHELRNPLAAILQSADGIMASLETPPDRPMNKLAADSICDAAETIIFCAQHQKRIVDDILTLSKLDSNLLVISPERVCPSQLLHKALKLYASELQLAGIRAYAQIQPSVVASNARYVIMDASRVLQIVINLLTNAIKFTQDSEVREIVLRLDASMSRPASGDNDINFVPTRSNAPKQVLGPEWGTGHEVYLQFSVQDSGKGLSEKMVSLLFQRFSQASPKTYQQYGGSGLGLFISRELSELQGGQIGVSSQAGKGSTFAFYVKARLWVPGTPFADRITWDNTPNPAPSQLASPMSTKGPAPSADVSGTESIVSSDAHLAVGQIQLNELSMFSQPVKSSSSQNERLHVLVVEDNIVNQKVMVKQIRAAGHVVHIASHGKEALEVIQQSNFWTADFYHSSSSSNLGRATSPPPNTPQVVISVILMDQEMPIMDGLTCVKRIREWQNEGILRSHIPIIAVTANARREQVAKLLLAGMDEVVTKPFRVPQVLEQAKELISRLEG